MVQREGAEGQGLNSTTVPVFRAKRRHLGRKRKQKAETSSTIATGRA